MAHNISLFKNIIKFTVEYHKIIHKDGQRAAPCALLMCIIFSILPASSRYFVMSKGGCNYCCLPLEVAIPVAPPHSTQCQWICSTKGLIGDLCKAFMFYYMEFSSLLGSLRCSNKNKLPIKVQEGMFSFNKNWLPSPALLHMVS